MKGDRVSAQASYHQSRCSSSSGTFLPHCGQWLVGLWRVRSGSCSNGLNNSSALLCVTGGRAQMYPGPQSAKQLGLLGLQSPLFSDKVLHLMLGVQHQKGCL